MAEYQSKYTGKEIDDGISKAFSVMQAIQSKAEKIHATATIGTTWVGSGPYTQSVAVSGLLESDTPIIDLMASTNPATAKAELSAWSAIYRIDTEDGGLTVYASEATTQEITIQLLGVR